jgi:hypothetical protein
MMAGKKGEIPEHVMQRQKKILSPEANHPVIKILSEVEDFRKPSLTFKYPLTSILFMTLIATICGATDSMDFYEKTVSKRV